MLGIQPQKSQQIEKPCPRFAYVLGEPAFLQTVLKLLLGKLCSPERPGSTPWS